MSWHIEIHGMPTLAINCLEFIRFLALETGNYTMLSGLQLERAAKCASALGSEELAANHLAKAEKLIIGVTFNISETRALISMYDRVLVVAASLGGRIPIKQHCEEMKRLLEASML